MSNNCTTLAVNRLCQKIKALDKKVDDNVLALDQTIETLEEVVDQCCSGGLPGLSATNLGSANPVYVDGSSPAFQFNTLRAGANITITPGGGELLISSVGGGGSITGGQNIGGATGEIFAGLTGTLIDFKTLSSTDNTVTITNNANTVDLSVPVTGANVGAGVGIFRDKVGNSINLHSLVSNDASITITDVGDEINLQVAGGGANTFTGLTDTPASYVGQADGIPAVNAGETALEFKQNQNLPLTDFTTEVGVFDGTTATTFDFRSLVSPAGSINVQLTPVPDTSGNNYISLEIASTNVENLVVFIDSTGNDNNDVTENATFSAPGGWPTNVTTPIFGGGNINALENSTAPVLTLARAMQIVREKGWNSNAYIVISDTATINAGGGNLLNMHVGNRGFQNEALVVYGFLSNINGTGNTVTINTAQQNVDTPNNVDNLLRLGGAGALTGATNGMTMLFPVGTIPSVPSVAPRFIIANVIDNNTADVATSNRDIFEGITISPPGPGFYDVEINQRDSTLRVNANQRWFGGNDTALVFKDIDIEIFSTNPVSFDDPQAILLWDHINTTFNNVGFINNSSLQPALFVSFNSPIFVSFSQPIDLTGSGLDTGGIYCSNAIGITTGFNFFLSSDTSNINFSVFDTRMGFSVDGASFTSGFTDCYFDALSNIRVDNGTSYEMNNCRFVNPVPYDDTYTNVEGTLIRASKSAFLQMRDVTIRDMTWTGNDDDDDINFGVIDCSKGFLEIDNIGIYNMTATNTGTQNCTMRILSFDNSTVDCDGQLDIQDLNDNVLVGDIDKCTLNMSNLTVDDISGPYDTTTPLCTIRNCNFTLDNINMTTFNTPITNLTNIMEMSSCMGNLNNMTIDGPVLQHTGSGLTLDNCYINSQGVTIGGMTDPVTMTNTKYKGQLFDGTNNNAGAQGCLLSDTTNMMNFGGSSLTVGGNDVKVGNNAVGAWANGNDFGAGSPQYCSLT